MHRIVELLEQLTTLVSKAEEQTENAQSDGSAELEQLEEARVFLRELREVFDKHGFGTTLTCLKLAPIAHAKGDSKAELDLMLDRMDRGLMTTCFVSIDPRNKRFPVEIIGTGRTTPFGVSTATVPEARTVSA